MATSGKFQSTYISKPLKKQVLLQALQFQANSGTKYIMFELKKYSPMALKIDAKFEGKLTCAFQNSHEEFCKFSQAGKQQFHFRK